MRKALKNAFIPHEGNDHKPHILRPRAIAAVCLVVVLAEAAFLFGMAHVAPRSRLFGIVVVNALTDGTNAARSQNNVAQLEVNPLLQAAAQEKANDMAANNYFAHTSPAGLSPWYWFGKVGYGFMYAGENLAVNFSDSGDVTNAWMNSPEHRANILSANFTQVGIATATGTYEGHPAVYVVEMFGAPAPVFAQTSGLPGISTAVAAANPPVAPVTKSTTTKGGAKPVISKVTQPTLPATTTIQPAQPNEAFVAVKGAAVTADANPTANPVQTPAVTPLQRIVESNPVQNAAANPRAVLNNFLMLIVLVFGFALVLNLFIRIRVQHPNLIMGGVMAISLAGLFILVNQQLITGVMIK